MRIIRPAWDRQGPWHWKGVRCPPPPWWTPCSPCWEARNRRMRRHLSPLLIKSFMKYSSSLSLFDLFELYSLHLKPCCGSGSVRIRNFYLPSRIWIRNKLISRIRIQIQNYHWASGLLKDKGSDKNSNFNIKSSISAQKWPVNVHSNFKCENFTKISQTRIRIRKEPQAGSGSRSKMTLQVGSGSEPQPCLKL